MSPSHSASVLDQVAGETCDDCAEHIEREMLGLPGLNGPALHLAVGALYGGSACDHVEYTDEDWTKALDALRAHAIRQRDRLREGINRVQDAYVREFGVSVGSDFLIEQIDAMFERVGLPR